jgi:nucleoside-diphosphate-sugar epimerase
MSVILIAGCGDVGEALGLRLAGDGHTVYGLRRHPESLPGPIRPLAADLTTPDSLRSLPDGIDLVFYTAAPGRRSEEAYRSVYLEGLRNLLQALEAQRLPVRRLFLTSSTSVYGQSDGEWVDETSPTEPTGFAGQVLLEAERLALGCPFPATVLRAAGIYGPGRTQLIESVRAGTLAFPATGPLYTNRIHRDDVAGILRHLAALPRPETLYLAVDNEPSDLREVAQWLAAKLGVPLPAHSSAVPPAQRHRRNSKRCRNDRLRATGYQFIYPTWREGYSALLTETQT